LGTTKADGVNFVDFEAKADGKPIPVQVEQRAVLKGKDVTAAVKAVGLPLNITAKDFIAKLDALPPEKRKTLVAEGLAEVDSDNVHPTWTVKTKFYWNQVFPAGKTVVVEHRYQPVTGQSQFGSSDLTDRERAGFNKKTFCLDAAAAARIKS